MMLRKKFDGNKDVGRPPRPGNSPVWVVSRRFYVKVTVSDLKAIVLPPNEADAGEQSEAEEAQDHGQQDPRQTQDLRANSVGKVL